jgi:hypothetical protein
VTKGVNIIYFGCHEEQDSLCGLVATDPEVRVRFPALPDSLRGNGPGTGSTQPREYN